MQKVKNTQNLPRFGNLPTVVRGGRQQPIEDPIDLTHKNNENKAQRTSNRKNRI